MPAYASTLISRCSIIAMVVSLFACGGGSSSVPDASPTADTPPTLSTAKVTLLLTDAPSDEFDEINILISSITLLGGDDPVVLFEGAETVDLLMLENFADLFAISDDVPAGTYNKIRLQIDNLELVRKDDEGNIIETIYPDLPANGKLDLNPRDSIDLAPGDDVVLQLDVDARRSIHIVGNGNGRYRFRPVVFVDLLNDNFNGKAVRVNGEIVAIDSGAATVDICQQRPSSADSDSDDGDSSEPDNDDSSDSDDGGECLTVNSNDKTGFFDSNADSASFADLVLGDAVIAIGRFVNRDISMFDATVVAVDTDNAFVRYDGVIQSTPNADNIFNFLLYAGQGVLAQPGTGIADDAGNLLDIGDIEPNVEAEIDGLMMLSNVNPDVLKAIYIALDLGDNASEEEIRVNGQVLSVDNTTGSLVIATGEGDRCVILDDAADIFLITVVDDVSTTDAISLSDVAIDSTADFYGEESVDGCLVATTILVIG